MSKALTKQRRNLWLRDPHCYYCGVETIFDFDRKGPVPPNFATIDHLRPRHHPLRREPAKNGEVRHVLACFKCNNERDTRELAVKPKEWFYENGGSKPMAHKTIEELQWVVLRLQHDLTRPQTKSRNKPRIQANIEVIKAEIASRARAQATESETIQ